MNSSVSGCTNTVIETLHLGWKHSPAVHIQTTEEFHHGKTFRRYFSPGNVASVLAVVLLNLECTKLKW
jgi:hypothetical protein